LNQALDAFKVAIDTAIAMKDESDMPRLLRHFNGVQQKVRESEERRAVLEGHGLE
jgi:hypothetical protein